MHFIIKSFISAKPEFQKDHQEIYQELLDKNLIKIHDQAVKNEHDSPGVKHYIAPSGTSSIVKHFFNKADKVSVEFNQHVNKISKNEDKWRFSTQNSSEEDFDAAILTMPVEQILKLPGFKDEIQDQNILENLAKVSYVGRYALGLFFKQPVVLEGNIQYLKDDDIFYYASNDTLKRGDISSTSSSIVLMTHSSFGSQFLDTPIPDVEEILCQKYKTLFPQWPEPDFIKCQRWRFSQVWNPYPGCPKAVVLNTCPLLIAGGDAFVSRFATVDSCIASAHEISRLVIKSH